MTPTPLRPDHATANGACGLPTDFRKDCIGCLLAWPPWRLAALSRRGAAALSRLPRIPQLVAGECIVKVSGHNSNFGYLAGSVILHTNKGRDIECRGKPRSTMGPVLVASPSSESRRQRKRSQNRLKSEVCIPHHPPTKLRRPSGALNEGPAGREDWIGCLVGLLFSLGRRCPRLSPACSTSTASNGSRGSTDTTYTGPAE